MKQRGFSIRVLVAMVGLMLAAAATQAAGTSERNLLGRVQHVQPGARQFEVTDQNGNRIQVTAPLGPHGMIDFYRGGEPVNASALRDGDMVLLTGFSHDKWFEARRAEILTGERVRGAKAPRPRVVTQVLRFTGFVSARELRATSKDGTEYRIVFPPQPGEASFLKAGKPANLSDLREGDLIVAHGTAIDHVIRPDRLEALDESRPGRGASTPPRLNYRGAPKPLRLTYRGSPEWRTLIGEAADGTRYTVLLPRRTQSFYFRRGGTLVETSALHPGDTIDVEGVIQGDRIEATRVTIRP